jgi:hypothetical protein
MKLVGLAVCSAVALFIFCMTSPTAFTEEMGAINIELPKPFFGGTPISCWAPNFEMTDYKDRVPFMAPKGTAIISRGKPIVASATPTLGELKQIVDGDKNYKKASLVELPEGIQWVQIDLEKTSAIYAVLVWHFHEGKRIYFDVVLQLSVDADFKNGTTTLSNSDYQNNLGFGAGKDKIYIEDHEGRLIDARGARGRYLRIYGNGSTHSDFNHFVEVEVWGKPVGSAVSKDPKA